MFYMNFAQPVAKKDTFAVLLLDVWYVVLVIYKIPGRIAQFFQSGYICFLNSYCKISATPVAIVTFPCHDTSWFLMILCFKYVLKNVFLIIMEIWAFKAMADQRRTRSLFESALAVNLAYNGYDDNKKWQSALVITEHLEKYARSREINFTTNYSKDRPMPLVLGFQTFSDAFDYLQEAEKTFKNYRFVFTNSQEVDWVI
jgi:hypothetical protein